MKKKLISLLLLSTMAITLLGCNNNKNKSLGEEAVRYLYQFDKITDLQEGDKKLKEISNDDVYKQLTVTDQYRALNTYLKLQDNPCKVVILDDFSDKNGGYVKYSLDTLSISSTRIFMFTYRTENNKLVEVHEMECIPFSTEDSLDITPSYDNGEGDSQ